MMKGGESFGDFVGKSKVKVVKNSENWGRVGKSGKTVGKSGE